MVGDLAKIDQYIGLSAHFVGSSSFSAYCDVLSDCSIDSRIEHARNANAIGALVTISVWSNHRIEYFFLATMHAMQWPNMMIAPRNVKDEQPE